LVALSICAAWENGPFDFIYFAIAKTSLCRCGMRASSSSVAARRSKFDTDKARATPASDRPDWLSLEAEIARTEIVQAHDNALDTSSLGA
jgi:hypothetical protein